MSPCSEPRELSVVGGASEAPDIEAVVRELRELYCVTGLNLALTIGQLVLDRIYGGDIALWHSRGHKDRSFRKLAEHPALPFAPSTLSRAVGIYEISLRREDLLRLPNVTSSHLQEVLRLPSEQQDRLIERASRDEWSVRRLRDEIERLQGAHGRAPRGGHGPEFARFLRTVGRQIDDAVLLQGVDQMEGLASEEAEELLRKVRALHEQSEAVIECLARHLLLLTGEAPGAQPGRLAGPRDRSDVAPRAVLRRRNTGPKRHGSGEDAA